MENNPNFSRNLNSAPRASYDRATFRIFGETTVERATTPPETYSKRNLEDLRRAFGSSFPLDRFREIYDHRTVMRDVNYTLKKMEEYGEEKFRAKNLENVTRFGVERADWLNADGETVVFPTIKYDDYFERIDFGVAMIPPEDTTEGRSKKLIFGVDVTYNPTKIDDKLARPTNDRMLVAPFGHSRIKYFNDGEEVGDKIVPRFVVAMDYLDDDKLTRQDPASPGMQRVRFKFLSQTVEQARRISEQLSGADPEEKKKTTRDMNDIYEHLDSALHECVSEILGSSDVSWRTLQFDISHPKTKDRRPYTFAEKVRLIARDCAGGDEVYKAMVEKIGIL